MINLRGCQQMGRNVKVSGEDLREKGQAELMDREVPFLKYRRETLEKSEDEGVRETADRRQPGNNRLLQCTSVMSPICFEVDVDAP